MKKILNKDIPEKLKVFLTFLSVFFVIFLGVFSYIQINEIKSLEYKLDESYKLQYKVIDIMKKEHSLEDLLLMEDLTDKQKETITDYYEEYNELEELVIEEESVNEKENSD